MRLIRRLNFTPLPGPNILVLALLFTVTSCSLPEVTLEKRQPLASNANGSSYSNSSEGVAKTDRKSSMDKLDKTYLATVQVRYSDTSAPVQIDIHRDRHNLIAFNLWKTEESLSYIHLGYTQSDGATAGIKFIWRFE